MKYINTIMLQDFEKTILITNPCQELLYESLVKWMRLNLATMSLKYEIQVFVLRPAVEVVLLFANREEVVAVAVYV